MLVVIFFISSDLLETFVVKVGNRPCASCPILKCYGAKRIKMLFYVNFLNSFEHISEYRISRLEVNNILTKFERHFYVNLAGAIVDFNLERTKPSLIKWY